MSAPVLRLRFWLAHRLLGRYSYAQNVVITGCIQFPNHPFGATFVRDVTVRQADPPIDQK